MDTLTDIQSRGLRKFYGMMSPRDVGVTNQTAKQLAKRGFLTTKLRTDGKIAYQISVKGLKYLENLQ